MQRSGKGDIMTNLEQFLADGGKVTVYNLGAKAVSLGACGLLKRKHG